MLEDGSARARAPTALWHPSAAGRRGCGDPAAQAGRGTAVAGTRPGWATPGNQARRRADGAKVVFSVWLGWRNQAELDALLADQQNPASPDYQRWLSPGQFRARFAPDADEVQQVTRWLRIAGLRPGDRAAATSCS